MNAETWLNLAKYALYVGTALVAIGTIGVSHFSSVVDRAKDRKMDDLLDGNRRLQEGNTELQEGNTELLTKVEKYQDDLELKQQEIEQLKRESVKSRRGIVSTWDFNGVRREGRAGSMAAILGDEVGVFQELTRLEKEGKHAEVIALATKQIERTPDWLTPYLARGVAYANIDEVQKAVADLEHVVDQAAGDPDYSQAGVVLQQLKGRGR